MGLSEAGRDVDETVRASKVADSNVRDEVSRRVRDLLGDDPTAFDAAPGDGEPDSDDTSASVAETAETDGRECSADDAETAGETTANRNGGESDAAPDGDDQASMEEYL